VRDLCGALLKAQRDYRRYPRNNPILGRRREELLARLSRLLEELGRLTLGVGPAQLVWEGQEVYRGAEGEREGLSAPLHRHGIRELTLEVGLSAVELEGLLDALALTPGADGEEEDLLGLLWERELEHVRWTMTEDLPADAGWATDPLGALSAALHEASLSGRRPPARPLPEAAALAHAAALRAPPAPDARASLAAVALPPEALQQLRAMQEEDRQRDVGVAVVDVLLSTLSTASLDPSDADELVGAMRRIVEVSLAEGQLRRAAQVLMHLGARALDPTLGPAVRGALHALSQESSLRFLVDRLKEGWGGTEEAELAALLAELPHEAAPVLFQALDVLADRRMRRVFCLALAEVAREDVKPLAPVVKTGSWYVARNLAWVLGLSRNPAGMPLLESLWRHPHERVRAEALRAALLLGGPRVRALVLAALADPAESVRLAALALLAAGAGASGTAGGTSGGTSGGTAAGTAGGSTAGTAGASAAGAARGGGLFADAAVGQALVAALKDKGFARLAPQEQRALAVAAGRTGREAPVAALAALLQPRSLLARGRVEPEQEAAVHGLVAAGTPEAGEALASAARELPALRPVVSAALAEAQQAAALARAGGPAKEGW
jgi:hypothetical protein